MAAISRRELIAGAASAGLARTLAAYAARPDDVPLGPLELPIGSQVYPLRSMLGDLPAFVRSMAELGVSRLELCSPIGYGAAFASLADGGQVRKILADHGMKAESSHFTMRVDRQRRWKSSGNWQRWDWSCLRR
jgi:hypothetical protein